MTEGTVIGARVEGRSLPYIGTLLYQYRVGASLYDGYLSRRCLRRRSAEALGAQAEGSTVEVRFKPDKPAQSYAVLALSWVGFAVAALPVLTTLAILVMLLFAVLQDRYIEAHDAIPPTVWRTLEVPGTFHIEMPGPATVTPSRFVRLEVEGKIPSVTGWEVNRKGAYFYAGVVQYPSGAKVTSEIFNRILQGIREENPKRYVYGDEPIALQERSGREFKFTRPYTTVRVYVDGDRLCVLATDWYVNSDTRRFFDSLRLE